MRPLEVFLDEGALDGDARFPSAAGIIAGDASAISAQIDDLIVELSLQPDFQLEPKAARLEHVGFHHVDDNFLARSRFKTLLPHLNFEWLCSSNLLIGDDDPYETLPDQFEWVASRILQKYRGRNVHFVFEQNHRLQKRYPGIVEAAAKSTRTPLTLVTHSIGTKTDRPLSIADYCIAISAQALKGWIDVCCEVNLLQKQFEYRDFAAIEPLCSLLFASNLRRSISGRNLRLADHSYFEITGFHTASCALAAPGGIN